MIDRHTCIESACAQLGDQHRPGVALEQAAGFQPLAKRANDVDIEVRQSARVVDVVERRIVAVRADAKRPGCGGPGREQDELRGQQR